MPEYCCGWMKVSIENCQGTFQWRSIFDEDTGKLLQRELVLNLYSLTKTGRASVNKVARPQVKFCPYCGASQLEKTT